MLRWALPCLLYCVAPTSTDPVPNTAGVLDHPVVVHDSEQLRIYWSEVANSQTLAESLADKSARLRYKQVLRKIVAQATPIAFPFPTVVSDLESLDKLIAGERTNYEAALTRLAGMMEYQVTATWTADAETDLATPVSGREYVKRRQRTEARIAALDSKLKGVTDGIVSEWRSRQDRRNHLWFALVPRTEGDRFLSALRNAGSSEGVRLRLSGPWPPSEFV